MAKGKGQRPLPSTPGPRPADGAAPPGPVPGPVPDAPVDEARPRTGRASARTARDAEPWLVAGTHCVAGHDRGNELEAGPIGPVPSRRRAWIGFGLLLWCGIGLALILEPQWVTMGIIVTFLWLLFSAFVQRRIGHRGRCWRTRSWRHAWGGLVPTPGR